MNYIATITSKRQLTIPSILFRTFGLSEGEKVLVSSENDFIKITKFNNLLDELAGSVKIPKRYRGLSSEAIIKKAKYEYFKK